MTFFSVPITYATINARKEPTFKTLYVSAATIRVFPALLPVPASPATNLNIGA